MAEKNEAVAKQPVAKKHSVGAAIKEFFRKQIVSLKRKPQNIAFLVVLVSCVFVYLVLGTYSQAIVVYGDTLDWLGLFVFVNTLLSALAVVAFMNTFPKMKKPGKKKKDKEGHEHYVENKTTITIQSGATKININLIMLGVFVVMCLVMIGCEIGYYILALDNYNYQEYATKTAEDFTNEAAYTNFAKGGTLFKNSLTYSIVHIVLTAVGMVLTFLVPVTSKLLNKINTSKELESAVSNMQEIDLAEDE